MTSSKIVSTVQLHATVVNVWIIELRLMMGEMHLCF